MAQNYFSIVTNKGRNKLALSAAGGAAVTITHFAIGDGNGAEANPTAASTALVREVWRTPVESVVIDPLNPSAVLVTSIIPTATGGWWMREFGIFDVDGDMIAVAKPVSQYKPTALEGQLEDIRYEFQIIIGETANVTMLVDPSIILASRAWVEARKVPVAQLSITPWVPVKSMTVTAPPANPTIWDTYLIPAGATGTWTGHAQKLAEWNGQAWNIVVPKDGHGIGLPDGRVFIRIGGVYVEWLASREWVAARKTPINQINGLPWLPVKSMTLTAPPATPAEGDLYLVATGATGAWAGKVGQIAERSSGAWQFSTPSDGHGISLPDGRVFERVAGVYVEKIALDAQSGKWNSASTGGTASALTVTLSPIPQSLADGMLINIVPSVRPNAGATLNVNGLGAKPLLGGDGSAIKLGDMMQAAPALLTYNVVLNGWVLLTAPRIISQVVGFKANTMATFSLAAGVLTFVKPTNKVFDVTNGYDTSTGEYTITKAGAYSISANIWMPDVDAPTILVICKNDAPVAENSSNSRGRVLAVSTIENLAVGDKIRLAVRQSSSSSVGVLAGTMQHSFSATLLGNI